MVTVKVITQLTQLDLSKLTKPFSFKFNHLGYDPRLLVKDFPYEDVKNEISFYAYQALIDSIVFFSGYNDEVGTDQSFFTITLMVKNEVIEFINMLWFVKDHSVNTHFFYTYSPERTMLTSIMVHDKYSTCTGDQVLTQFTYEELELTQTIFTKLFPLISGDIPLELREENNVTFEPFQVQTSHQNKLNYNVKNRINRAYDFLKRARTESFIVMKLSLYVNIYECLFGTDASEIIHKLAERVACYYTKDPNERIELFRFFKKVYNCTISIFSWQRIR